MKTFYFTLILSSLFPFLLYAENDLQWHHSYEEAQAEAEASKKPIFLVFR